MPSFGYVQTEEELRASSFTPSLFKNSLTKGSVFDFPISLNKLSPSTVLVAEEKEPIQKIKIRHNTIPKLFAKDEILGK